MLASLHSAEVKIALGELTERISRDGTHRRFDVNC